MRRILFIFAVSVLALASSARAQIRLIHTPHYLIHTDLEDSLANDMAGRMEGMFNEYSQRLAAFNSTSHYPRMEVYIFRHQSDYLTLTGGRMQNTGGMFLPGRNLLAAFLEGQGRQQLRRTLQHEAFHQFAYNAISPDLPIWLNEGLAQFFEEGLWNGPGLLLGEVPPRRVRQLRADVKTDHLIPFSQLLNMSEEQWARRLSANRTDGAIQYNQSWAMVHFLVMGHNSRGEYLLRPRLLAMLRMMHEGRPASDAFAQVFGTNTRGFQDHFTEYAQNLQPTAEATLIENQSVLADLLTDFARDGRRFDDVEAFRKLIIRGHYKLHYTLGNIEWDTNPNLNVYFSDLAGNRFAPEQLYFSPRTGAPVDDIVCKYNNNLVLRTRFYDTGPHSIDHDLVIEVSNMTVSISR
jgi:hypothetical protein